MFTILLLNFLIAVISQSYEGTMMRSEQILYTQRAHLNVEVLILKKAFTFLLSLVLNICKNRVLCHIILLPVFIVMTIMLGPKFTFK